MIRLRGRRKLAVAAKRNKKKIINGGYGINFFFFSLQIEVSIRKFLSLFCKSLCIIYCIDFVYFLSFFPTLLNFDIDESFTLQRKNSLFDIGKPYLIAVNVN